MAENSTIPCPSCGKHNPPDTRICRFCTANFQERAPLRWINYGIMLLFIVALIHFYKAATHRPELVPFHVMTPDMNFEKIRATGRVREISITEARYGQHVVKMELFSEEPASLPYKHRSITAKLEGEAAGDFVAWKNPPRAGDLVEVAATLYAGEGFRHLSVSALPFIRILERAPESTDSAGPLKTPPPEVSIQQLLASPETYRDKDVRLPLVEVTFANPAQPFFRARDVADTNQTLVILGYKGVPLEPGQRLDVRGKFVFYEKNKYWEIVIPRGDDKAVTLLPAETSGK